jgi:outer membrane usher protein
MAGLGCVVRSTLAMPLLASCALALPTSAAGSDTQLGSLVGANSASWFAPGSARTTRGAKPNLSGVFEASLSNGYGVGTVRLKSDQEPGNARVARLDTTWTTEVSGQRDTLRLGDSINQPGTWGRPVRFGGLHYGTDLGGPLAATPWSAPEAVGTLTPRVAPALVRPGFVDRAYAVGFLRSNYGLDGDGYGAAFASATIRFGVSEDVTAELRGSAQRGIGNGGVALQFRLDGLGLVTAAAAASDSEAGTGRLAQTGFEVQRGRFSASVSAAWASAEFRQLQPDDAGIPPRYWSVASATYDTTRYGVFGIGYAALADGDEGRQETVQGTYRVAVGPLSTLAVSVAQTFGPEPDTSLMLTVTLPLDPPTSESRARAGAASSTTMWLVDRPSRPATAASAFSDEG